MSKEANNWTGCYEGGWNDLIVPEAFAHPAKFSYSLTERMIGHAIRNEWIGKGSVVVDPFGGVGCGGIVAAYNDLVWIGCELELKFVDLAGQNFEMHRRKWEKLGCPQPVIVQGDSRRLCEVLSEADIVISSPPYAGIAQQCAGHQDVRSEMKKGKWRSDRPEGSYGTTPGNLGNLKPGDVDAIISSPPWENQEGSMQSKKFKDADYSAKMLADRCASGQTKGHYATPAARKRAMDKANNQIYGDSQGQLGNDKGDTFWHAARQIVSECHKILKPGGQPIKDGENIIFCDCKK